MNFITMLKNDHAEAKQTFKSLLDKEPINQKETEILCKKLLLHMEMEEKYFYPIMEKYKETGEITEEAELEHDEAKKFINAILKEKLAGTEYKVKLEMLQLAIEHHIEEEEGELFPKTQEKLSKQQIQEITDKMLELKAKKQKLLTHK